MQTVIPRLWTVNEYHRLSELGLFHPEERLELIEGQIIQMAAKGTAHTSATRRTLKVLRRLLKNQAEVYSQDPVQLNDFSEPEPDIFVVVPDPQEYLDHHPTASEIYLIIEVADSSLQYDCETKAIAYSRSGILDYWVLDVNERQLRVFREPTQQGYRQKTVLNADQTIFLYYFPDIALSVYELLPLINL